MLEELLNELKNIEKEVNEEHIKQLPIEERVALLQNLAEKVLNTLENADIKIPKEYSIDGGDEIPTSEI